MFRALVLLSAVLPTAGTSNHADDPAFVVVRSIDPKAEDADRPTIASYGITYEDVDRLVAAVPAIAHAVPIRDIAREARVMGRTHAAVVVGTTPRYLDLAGLEIDRGRALTERDNERYENVAVLGPAVAEALFPSADPVGQAIKLGTDYYTIVGVAKRTGDPTRVRALLGREVGDDVIIPLNTCRLRFGDRIIDNRGGTFRAEEVQVSRLILEIRGDPEAARRAIEATLKPSHPEGDVEIRLVTPRTRDD